MFTANRHIARVHELGRQEGREDALRDLLLKYLRLRFQIEPGPGMRQRVEAADGPTLEVWAERIITAESPEAVFDG